MMSAIRLPYLPVLALLFFLLLRGTCFSQGSSLQAREWVKKLSSRHDNKNTSYTEIYEELSGSDSAYVFSFIAEMENIQAGDPYCKTRLLLLKAYQMYRFQFPDKVSLIKKYGEQALFEAYKSGDEYLMAFVNGMLGTLMFGLQEIELSVAYYLKADEIHRQLQHKGSQPYNIWLPLGEALFHTRDYEQSIYYTKKGLAHESDTSIMSNYYRIRYYNTVGQGYQKTGKADSALAYFEKSMQLAMKLNDNTWKAINSGFMGQVFFLKGEYKKAKELLEYDYSISKNDDWNIAAYTLQWLARISLAEGDKHTALRQVREALHFINKTIWFPLQRDNYLQYIYYTAADVFRALGNADSVFHYVQLYTALHDSLERVATLSSIKLAQLRNENEKNFQAIQRLQNEKKAELVKRNTWIGAILLLSVIAFLFINRLRLKHRYKEQLALRQKEAAESDMETAKVRLQLFTQNLIEKSNLIEKLQQEIREQEKTAQNELLVEELSRHHILTEEDWDKFKTLFEKLNRGFFRKLKEAASDITVAEQRMAALIRLQLSVKQMAAMLGISADSVNKTRQRLRHRLQLVNDVNLEAFIHRL